MTEQSLRFFLSTEAERTFVDVLHRLTQEYTHADMSICGGFLRDLHMQKPFNDVDVYIHLDEMPTNVSKIEWISDEDEKYKHHYIQALAHSKIKGRYSDKEYNINWVVLSREMSTPEIIKMFDVGLCMVGFGIRDGLHVDKRFFFDASNEWLINYRSDWGEAGVTAHIERLKKKYPWPAYDAEYVIDEDFGETDEVSHFRLRD